MDGNNDDIVVPDAGEAANLALLLAHPGPPPPERGDPLLPAPLARGITLSTGTIRGAVRTARSVGRVPFWAARYTTAAGIELGRQVVEGVLDRAGRRLADKAGHAEGEAAAVTTAATTSAVSSTFDVAARGFSYLQLLAAAGFELTGSSVAALLDGSDVLLLLLDGTLGATESSRALRSLVAFLSKEFQNPATGRPGERVGARDLLWGLCGLVYLQTACRRLDAAARSRAAVDAVVWDVVVLDGRRVDVHEASLYGGHGDDGYGGRSAPGDIPSQIVNAVTAAGAQAVAVSTVTMTTITVDITGTQPLPPITPPPGVELLELGPVPSSSDQPTTHRIVFRINTTTPTLPSVTTPKTPLLVEQVDTKIDTPMPDAPRSPSPPPPPPKQKPGPPLPLANQKKVRLPPARTLSVPPKTQSVVVHNSSAAGRRQPPPVSAPVPEKKGPDDRKAPSTGFRAVLKRPGLGNLLHRDAAAAQQQGKAAGGTPPQPPPKKQPPTTQSKAVVAASKPPQMVLTPLTSRALYRHAGPSTSSRGGPVDTHTHRRSLTADDLESLASLASLASSFADNRSVHAATDQMVAGSADASRDHGSPRRHRANRDSIYTLHTNDSQASLVVSSYGRRSESTGTADALDEVRRTGCVPGLFPAAPLPANLQRYMRFASAAYGRDFLRAMGMGGGGNASSAYEHHREITAYARHTGVAPEDIVLASFIEGGSEENASPPLVHYVALDHAARAVVLACRGTLGFEDILADMACAYDALTWRGRAYQVHQGVHAAARRLLYGGDGRVLATLRAALLRHPGYGLVLCGHSLGGAVTALLGVMLGEPGSGGLEASAFQTAALPLLTDADADGSADDSAAGSAVGLPAGRPLHVYAYGPPGTMSPRLCRATRGLITSVVHGDDLVPSLSLGVLHDFQAVALALKDDKGELWARLWAHCRRRLWATAEAEAETTNDEAWAYAALKTLRASMLSQKLLPPGEVLVVETQRVLQRTTYGDLGGSGGTTLRVSPARRIVLKYVRDVEARFREIQFGLAAFVDHSPGRYEKALEQLVAGVHL